MMTEISLSILDIAENSIVAEASCIIIDVEVDTKQDCLTVSIKDDGKGMDEEELMKAADPFYTTRTTRRIGLGIPFFKQSVEAAGGEFFMASERGKGTEIKGTFKLSGIDRMPLGDINETIYTLVVFNKKIDFVYRYSYDEREFRFDTKEFKKILGDVPLDTPEVSEYIKEFLEENKREVDMGAYI